MIIGEVKLFGVIDGESVDIPAMVVNTSGPDSILGYQFLAAHNLLIDCKKRMLLKKDKSKVVRCIMQYALPVECTAVEDKQFSGVKTMIEILNKLIKEIPSVVLRLGQQKNCHSLE